MGIFDGINDTGAGIFGDGVDFGISPEAQIDPLDLFSGRGAKAAANSAASLQANAIIRSAEIGAESQQKGLDALLEQLGITRESFAPFLAAGGGALEELIQGFRPQRGTDARGLDANLAELFDTDIFGTLVGERQRAAQGQLAAGGLTRSGTALQEASRIPTELGLNLESMLFGRGTQEEVARIQGLQSLVNTGLSAAGTTGGQGANLTSQIVSQLSNIGATQGQGITGAAGASAAGILGAAQASAQGKQNLLNLGGAALSFFSDPRLKANVKKVGKAGPLDLVTWEWIPELKDSFVKNFPKIGYLSTQVRKYYPQYVDTFGGFDIIDYRNLRKELECQAIST